MTAVNVASAVLASVGFLWLCPPRWDSAAAERQRRRRHGQIFALAGLLAVLWWSLYANYVGATLDYDDYIVHWRLVLEGGQAPWGEHSTNAYGPLYNMLAWIAWVDPFLPKSLFVGVWVCSGVWLATFALRRWQPVWLGYGIVLVALGGPFFVLLVSHYGFNDILPAVLCLIAVHLRLKNRDAGAGAALAAAVLLKYYPAAMLPLLMLDGRRLRWRLGAWCVGITGAGMAASFWYWGESTLHPLAFGAERPSKWLSIFRFLRGPYSPLGLVMDEPNADALSMPAMVIFGGAVWLTCWVRRVPTAPACIAGLATALQFYKVGHVQFQMSVVLLMFYYAANGGYTRPGSRWQAVAAVAYFLWLSGFELVFVVLRRFARGGPLEQACRDLAGLIGLAMTLWLVGSILTARHRIMTDRVTLSTDSPQAEPDLTPDS
jgi:hypothetical protein